jgi:hypothetical protein
MIPGIIIIVGGIIYFINPNAFKSLNNKWTSANRDSMLSYQYEKRIRRIAAATILIGIFFVVKELFFKK